MITWQEIEGNRRTMANKGYLIDFRRNHLRRERPIPAGEAFVHELQKREIPHLLGPTIQLAP